MIKKSKQVLSKLAKKSQGVISGLNLPSVSDVDPKVYDYQFVDKVLKTKIDKHLFLVCAPKSGSTWLSHVVEELLDWPSVRLAPSFEHREQEIDLLPLLRNSNAPKVYSSHQHCRYSLYTEKVCRLINSHIVLQVRDIFDTVYSYVDHMNKESVRVPAGFMNDEIWSKMDDEAKFSFVVDMIIPWYFNFYAGWMTSPLRQEGKVHLITYQDLKEDFGGVIKGIFNFMDEPLSDDKLNNALSASNQANTRKNKGVSGRGSGLSPELKDRIRLYASYYPNVDFSPLGL
ncbi:MAG: hypothetical protein EP346_05185 [Bacteroidetes bacterium]|nr:MAG: hypothetical protein EP346_05185 [Bacteroidota bacterium]